MAFNIEKADVLWKWNDVYRNLGDKAEAFTRYFIQDMDSCHLPETTVEVIELKVGLIFGGRREYIEIVAKHLKDCRLFLSARKYGNHLSVSNYLVYSPDILGRLLHGGINAFTYQDLGDYLASCELSVNEALSKVAQESGLDPKELKAEFKPLEIVKAKK